MRTIKTTSITILALSLLAGSTLGVTAQSEEDVAEVASFSGTLSFMDVANEGTNTELGNGFTMMDGFTVLNAIESDDPRFTGNHSVVISIVGDGGGMDALPRPNHLVATTHQVSNDEGRWIGEGAAFSSQDLDLGFGDLVRFVGRDGYEGLTAYARIDGGQEPPTIDGVIFPVAPPTAGEPYAGE